MNYDRSDFVESVAKQRLEKDEQQIPQILQVKSAALSAEMLTGSVEWDKFLGYLQAVREQIERDRQMLGDDLDDPKITDPDTVMGIKTRRAAMATNLELLDAIMQLPIDLVNGGKEADKIMERFTSESSAA